ncbi:MAG: hypothetical protein AAF414_16150 [Pseudomonadota bacterium]
MLVNSLIAAGSSAKPYRLVMTVLVGAAAGALLSGCGGSSSGLSALGGSTYAGDIEPTGGRVQRVEEAELPAFAVLVPEGQELAPPPIVEQISEGEPEEEATDEIGEDIEESAPTPVSEPTPLVTPQPPPREQVAAAPPPPQVNTAPPPQPTPAPVVSQTPPPPQPSATTNVEPERVVPDPSSRGPRLIDFPNLADVPETPDNLPTSDETDAVRAELEADREAINRGEDPPSVASGSILQSVRDRLGVGSTTPDGARVVFDSGSTTLSLGGLAIAQSAAVRQIESGSEVRLVGFAYASSEANRPAALGIALDRANAVASALVSYGVDPALISVFANTLTDVSEQNEDSSRRVDITFQ